MARGGTFAVVVDSSIVVGAVGIVVVDIVVVGVVVVAVVVGPAVAGAGQWVVVGVVVWGLRCQFDASPLWVKPLASF